ncbi:MAG: hypothetical protein AAGK32_07150, partial [Actinomycetota bacterium]
MCGIAGVLRPPGQVPDPAQLDAMAVAMAHRGPDASGAAAADEFGVAATRLALVDPGPTGIQPLRHAGNLLAFNGEIYNHRALRRDLVAEGVHFDGHSDTEVLLHALDRWGVDRTVGDLEGMFAFAWWDGTSLHLARDRFGRSLAAAVDVGGEQAMVLVVGHGEGGEQGRVDTTAEHRPHRRVGDDHRPDRVVGQPGQSGHDLVRSRPGQLTVQGLVHEVDQPVEGSLDRLPARTGLDDVARAHVAN